MSQSQSALSVSSSAREDAAPPDPTLVAKLQNAAKLANENCDRATALAHKLSAQLRDAQSRINHLELEAERTRPGCRRWSRGSRALSRPLPAFWIWCSYRGCVDNLQAAAL